MRLPVLSQSCEALRLLLLSHHHMFGSFHFCPSNISPNNIQRRLGPPTGNGPCSENDRHLRSPSNLSSFTPCFLLQRYLHFKLGFQNSIWCKGCKKQWGESLIARHTDYIFQLLSHVTTVGMIIK